MSELFFSYIYLVDGTVGIAQIFTAQTSKDFIEQALNCDIMCWRIMYKFETCPTYKDLLKVQSSGKKVLTTRNIC